MKLIFLFLSITVCIPSLVLSQQLFCHRCYGDSYCNNVTHPDFAANVRNATCNINALDLDIDDPVLSQVQGAINENFLSDFSGGQVSPLNSTLQGQGQCITATVHEPHGTHTLRACVVRNISPGDNTTLCELLGSIVSTQNRHGGNFTCRECLDSHFCNNHTLSITDGIAPPPPGPGASSMVSASFVYIIAMITLFRLF